MGRELSEIKFPRKLEVIASDDVQVAATCWNDFRMALIKSLERALALGCDYRDIFTSLLTAACPVGTGNSRLSAFLLDLIEDRHLSSNPVLACDVSCCVSVTGRSLMGLRASPRNLPLWNGTG